MNSEAAFTATVPSTLPIDGCEFDVIVDSVHAPAASDTCIEPGVPILPTHKTKLTLVIAVTATPGGRFVRSNFTKLRVLPPTCRKGELPKFTPGRALFTCASAATGSVSAASRSESASARKTL